MLTINARNVNDALRLGIIYTQDGIVISPRGKETIEYPGPVATVYNSPTERVLFSPARDANPFFHLMESLWLLAGRQDVAFVSQFNSNMRQYSDDGVIYHGAYGNRLRNCGKDQIEAVIRLLKRDPDTRQAVMQIWDFNKDLDADSKDIPCNDMIFLKIRGGKLNITVCCRSNDMIWGAYGSNMVMFSMLQEYMAARIGVEVGIYTQVSDSFHVYTDNPQYPMILNEGGMVLNDPYSGQVTPYPLVANPNVWDAELDQFMSEDHNWELWDNPFFPEVAIPVYRAWFAHKVTKGGWRLLPQIKATDWRLACEQWLARRGDVNPTAK